jgi:hypothetical protein
MPTPSRGVVAVVRPAEVKEDVWYWWCCRWRRWRNRRWSHKNSGPQSHLRGRKVSKPAQRWWVRWWRLSQEVVGAVGFDLMEVRPWLESTRTSSNDWIEMRVHLASSHCGRYKKRRQWTFCESHKSQPIDLQNTYSVECWIPFFLWSYYVFGWDLLIWSQTHHGGFGTWCGVVMHFRVSQHRWQCQV